MSTRNACPIHFSVILDIKTVRVREGWEKSSFKPTPLDLLLCKKTKKKKDSIEVKWLFQVSSPIYHMYVGFHNLLQKTLPGI